MRKSPDLFRILLGCLLVYPLAGCIPNSTRDVDKHELRFVTIDSIHTNNPNDTLAAGEPPHLSAWYVTGSRDCHLPADTIVTRNDTTFHVAVQETVYTERLCMSVALAELLTCRLANSLPPGKYVILANEHTSDTLRYEFVVE